MTMILPGSTIGVFGSGQLGRMFAIEARKLGYRVHTFSPDNDTPTGQVADIETTASYEDLQAVERFAKSVHAVTFEFENVPAATIETAARFVPVHPSGTALHITQNRLREKNFLESNGFPTTAFRHVVDEESLRSAVREIGMPSVLKTAGFGYDGKGQTKILTADDIVGAFERIGSTDAILEAFVDFEMEVSVVAARNSSGEFADYGVIENSHANHILDVSNHPARCSDSITEEAVAIARGIAEKLNYVGTFCVEFFLTRDSRLLVNEIAPRPHNSGHLTFDGCATSQFEQQLRAVCGLPMGSTKYFGPTAMANLLGDVWNDGEPDWNSALGDPRVKLHLYGKSEPRPGRKMGHITAVCDSVDEAILAVTSARKRLFRQK
jgi:5-(carboxyamino)imidazole ribonucleotide synthase